VIEQIRALAQSGHGLLLGHRPEAYHQQQDFQKPLVLMVVVKAQLVQTPQSVCIPSAHVIQFA
jgi:hypothetical protein